jgi:SAM-dependent methyltransferase
MDLRTVSEHAAKFKQKILHVKRDLGAVDFEWYPHDTLTALDHLDRLLTGTHRLLFPDKRQRIIDIGCQDGELSFLLESLGHDVTALDHPAYSHNGMRGVRALKSALNSSITLHEIDLDQQFSLPGSDYDLALFLGVLYHLRNPFYILEEIARRTSSCLLSTRIARRFPDGTNMPPGVAMAYLLDERELNEDDSNYFIFSEAGLRVMLKRTHWDICEYMSAGDTTTSDPVRLDRDERVFCLLASRYERLSNVELLEGWHESEATGWRWTKREFSARILWKEPFPPRRLAAQLFLPESLMDPAGQLRVSLSVNGRPLPPEVFRTPGAQSLVRALPVTMADDFLVHFSLSHALPPDQDDARERGLIVTSLHMG